MTPAMPPSEIVGKKSIIVLSTTEPLLYLRKKTKEKEKETTEPFRITYRDYPIAQIKL